MTAEEVLNTMSEPENETLQFCMIDPETRTISLPDCYKIFGVESDENATRVRFRCPVIVGDGVDLMNASLRIIYRNANKEEGPPYIISDTVLNGDCVEFSWLLGRHVTGYKGAVTFIFCVVKTDENGQIVNEWNTTLASSKVLEGLEPDTASIEDTKEDIIAQLLNVVRNDIQVTVTKESVTTALGYTPANDAEVTQLKSDFTEHGDDKTSHVTSAERTAWNNKSNFSGSYNDLSNKPNIPTKTSQLTNDSGFLTQHQDLSAYAKKTEIPTVPTSLKNPYALTMNVGGTTYTYDGSKSISITIDDGNEVAY